MSEDTVRVLRVIEYAGPRSKVEQQVARSLHGSKDYGNGVIISVATLGDYPQVIYEARLHFRLTWWQRFLHLWEDVMSDARPGRRGT